MSPLALGPLLFLAHVPADRAEAEKKHVRNPLLSLVLLSRIFEPALDHVLKEQSFLSLAEVLVVSLSYGYGQRLKQLRGKSVKVDLHEVISQQPHQLGRRLATAEQAACEVSEGRLATIGIALFIHLFCRETFSDTPLLKRTKVLQSTPC